MDEIQPQDFEVRVTVMVPAGHRDYVREQLAKALLAKPGPEIVDVHIDGRTWVPR